MNRKILVGLVALLAANSLLLAEQPAYKPGVVLVRFVNDPNATAKSAILNSALGKGGSSVKRNYTLVKGLSQVSLPTGVSVESAVTSLKQSSSVLYAGPDYISHTFIVPNDTRFSDLWGMRNTGQAGGAPGADIDATAAWDISTGSSSIVVAVTDSGVDYTHPDLAANMWRDPNGNFGYDFANNDNDPMDDLGHGTHVAGIIGAVGNNNLGVAGVCWRVRIMAVKIIDANGQGYLSDLISGVDYAVSNGARVINASWGFAPGVPLSAVQPLYDAISAAQGANVIFVAAAGNNYGNNNDVSPVYPASFDLDNIISVMAVTNTDSVSGYSNHGLTSVDIGAPGGSNSGGSDDILSTYPGGGYAYRAGTSMASPHVAGACALLLSIDSTLNFSEVKQIVLDTIDPTLPALCVSGGRLNLAAAAQEAAVDRTPPTPHTAGWLMPPVATGMHTIAMEAQNEIDRSNVEYYFECVDDVNINSGWEPNALYVFKDPGELKIKRGTSYRFRVKARDKSANHNETAWSSIMDANTAASVDNLPPAPSPARWAIQPIMIRPNPLTLRMKIKGKGTDENGELFKYKYYDYTVSGPVTETGWLSSADGTMPNLTGLTANHTYVFNCKVKDNLGNETGWSTDVYVALTTVTTPRILHVPSEYLTIQTAIDVAVNGDIVEVSPYPVPPYYYQGINIRGLESNMNLRFRGKAITVRSTNPEDPCVVARTIIDCNGPIDYTGPRRAFIFDQGEGPGSILAGFTIRNAYVKGHPGRDGDANLADINALPGRTAAGGAILCGPNPDPCTTIELSYTNWGTGFGSPTIRNCVFINCVVEGGDGGLGADGNDGNDYVPEVNNGGIITPESNAMPGQSGGHGGRSGAGLGGAIYCSPGSNPVIKNCDIINCYALSGVPGTGGNGGNGGNDPNTGQEAGGNAGNGADVNYVKGGGICADRWGSNPQIIGCNINDCNARVITTFSSAGVPGAGDPPGQPSYYYPNFGQAYGGGVYYATVNAAVNISSTTFTRNRAQTDPEGGIYKDAFGGGIVLDIFGTATTTMTDCNFTGNSADTYGGGVYYWGSGAGAGLFLQNCELTGNTATVVGGGLYGLFYGTDIFDAHNSDIRGNNAPYGGGFYLDSTFPLIEDCNFADNQAQEGGALIAVNCLVDIHGSNITGNAAVTPSGIGGGLALWNSYGLVTDCIMSGNRTEGYGGAAFVEGYATAPLQFINCLITNNTAVYDGGGLSNKTWAWTQLINCTLVNNSSTDETYGSGGGVSCEEYWAWVEIYNSILWNNSAAYGRQIGVGSTFGSELGENNANVDVWYSDVEGGQGQAFVENPAYMAVWWWPGSFDADPCFVNIDINQPAYYLSQVAAGQLEPNSPCVDAGDPAFVTVGWLETFVGALVTTRTDLVEDAGIIDIGYHYKAGSVGKYSLTIGVYEYDPNEGYGRLNAKTTPQNDTQFDINDPCTIQVNQGTVLNLTAIADPGYRVQSWSGTDNDTSTALTNTVTMNSNRNVIVTFEPNGLYYLTVTVIGGNGTVDPNGRTLRTPGEVVPLIATPANQEDVVIWTGTDNDNVDVNTNTVTMTGHRNVYVRFYTPRILHVGGSIGYPTIQAAIDAANERDIIILMPSSQPYYTQTGFSIIGRNITITSINPDDPAVVASTIIEQQTGPDSGVSPAFLFQDVGPLMRLQGITIRGFSGTGLNGLNGDPAQGYYDGQYGSTAGAMGIECVTNASPTIKNCVIDNCHTAGGDGGNGAAGNFGATPPHPNAGNGGWPGGAWGGGLLCYDNSNPTLINCTFSNNSATGGNGGDGGNGSGLPNTGYGGRGGGWHYGIDDQPPSPWEPGAYLGGEPKDYSGLGGAVYVGPSCYPIFEGCTFTNNFSNGGLNGICGQTPIANLRAEPTIRYKIDNLGGAVYLAAYSSADFNNCTFTTNIADTNRLPASFDGFLGFGGAIAADNYATPIIRNCSFSNNTSDVGGGVYTFLSEAEVNDCNFLGNTATHGGGLLFTDSVAYVTGSTFSGNVGIISGSDGGAIGLLGTNAEIADCNISNNRVGGSGGGIYISSKNVDGNEIEGDNYVLVKNCLITGNVADLDGGAISANWYSDVNIVNCTIFGNRVSGFGGGLFSSYGSYVNVLNSIFWDNEAGIGASGNQIAVGGGEFPSVVQVLYSDVQDSNDPCAWVNDINAIDFVICFDTTGSMGGDINAIRTTAGQIVNAIAAQYADYRLALVDFRDYPDGNYGSPGDWPYLDRVRFTTNANQLINGLQPMVAGGGADVPEAIYTALMHCIDANALAARLTANGYANYIEPNSPGLGNWRRGGNVMRVILLLTDAPPHDPENYTNYVLNDIIAAATGPNPIRIIPVVIRGDTYAENALRPVAIRTGGSLIMATDSNEVPGAVLDAISILSQISVPIFVEPEGTINWDPATFTWALGSHNINADPLFIGGFFLSQIDAGQPVTSPCVDAGSADVNSPGINLAGYTTRTDGANDVNIVDMGYHYPLFTPHQYSLTIEVNGAGGRLFALGRGDSNFTIEAPSIRLVNANTVVSLQALAGANYGVLRWTGTDNDASIDPNNTVTMDSDKVVKVEFHQYRLTIEVMGPNGLDPNGYLDANGTGVDPFTIRARVEPNSCGAAPGRVVNLNAVPDANFRVRVWMGTDNDACTTPTNTVTMNSDKTVRVGFEPNGWYYLTVTAIGDGTVTPVGRYLRRPGDVVTLTATATNPADAIIWTGTDDDYSTARQNTVTMNGHKDVTVEFYTPRILYVGTDTNYPTIQFAIDAAQDRDIVMITPGTYNIYESSKDRPYLYISGKEIRLTSTNPEDANATQIIGGFVIENANRRLIIEGLTIRDAIYWKDYENGNAIRGEQNPFAEWHYDPPPQPAGQDGYGGGTCRGAGMQLNGAASPTVRNCLFINCVARGIHGQTGAGGTGADGYSGNGGPGGKAFGGGAYCGQNGSPLFEDCSFINCSARAGDAGNGGSAAPATGGHGGAWGDRNGVWWNEWRTLYGAIHPLEEYWKYSGYGGAIYCDVNSTAEFRNCTFTGNSTMGSSCGISGASVPSGWPTAHYKIESFGGAVYAASGSAPQFVECNFTDNEANMQGPPTSRKDNIATVNAYPNVSFGGAVAFEDGAAPEFNECTFNGNRATIGGGVFAAWSYGIVADCNFEDNSSYSGGGILYVGGTSEILNSRFTGNQSTVSAAQGGAITLLGANAEIRDCNIWANATAGSGGGIYVSSQDVDGYELPGGDTVLIKNCLITGNSAGQNGAGISAVWYSDPNIVNCTIVDNNAQGMGGGLYSAYNNYTNVINSIFWDNIAPQGPQIAIGTAANPAYVKVTYSDIKGGAADVYLLVPSANLEWDVALSNPHYPTNINTDPLFIGNYYLSQIAAGQISNSPCVDRGNADINSPDINLGGYSTRTDGVADVGTVDMGYHYSASFVPPQYHLTIIAVDGLTSANITPGDGNHVWFTKVPLHVNIAPPAGYQIVWTGTDNDDINDGNNSVRMTGDKTVTVGFGKNTCNLTVISSSGGTVTPTSGTYPRGTNVDLTATPNTGYRIESWEGTNNDGLFTRTNIVTMNGDKTVRVTFSLPQKRTVPGEYTTIQEAIEAARSGDIVSVSSGVYHGSTLVLNKEITLSSTNPDDPCVVAETIIDSTGYEGGRALYFSAGATANTVVDGFTITSGTYGMVDVGNAAQAGQNGPDGYSYQGGTVYIDTGASPTLRNCVIRDTSITGGNAGSGGNADATTPAGRGGWGGWARGGGIYVAQFANPTLVNCTITNCTVTGGNAGNGGNSSGTLGAGYQDANHGGLWSNDFSFPWRQMVGADGEPCYIGDYRFYSGYGGGVFCDANSEANFINCNITNNIARGGMSGIGGTRPAGVFIPDPVTAYRIPSYGGGVYCGANSDINFVGCVISGNVTPRPDATYHTDPYLGHGGGIAFEDTAGIRLQDCTISDNNSAVGGGMFCAGGEPEVVNCEIMRNTAYLGGGIYAMGSAGQIRGCTLRDNFAGVSAGDVDVVAGQGGGIFGSSIDTVTADCILTNNTSSTSGGGIHIYGSGDANTIIKNCLLTGNQAGRDGGGISANWGAAVSVENCTLYNNRATGTFGELGNTGFGGGLYCSYEAQTDVKNSIFWDNNGLYGKEIAEGIGFVESGTTDIYYCGTVSVSYSDIKGGQAGVLVSDGCPLIWGLGNMDIDPCFVDAVSDDFHLQQIAGGQMVDSNCVDAGGDLAVSLGLFRYTTSSLGTPDTEIVDLGYHYPITDYCRRWDLYVDNFIDFRDFAVFASAWVDDLGDVGYGVYDLKEFTYCWLEELAGDMNAPVPNPMTWEIRPRALTSNSVEMRATTAVDSSGQVYYQFEQVGGPLSAWQTDTYYVATGISPTGEYCFRVRARDKYNNTTAWSEQACVSDIGDVNSPAPAPVFVPVAAENITREDANTASGQFQWDPVNFHFDWWHRVIVDVTGVADDITPTSELEVRFICGNSAYSSNNVIPAEFRPIRIGYPVTIGGRIPDGGGAASGSYRLTWNGVNQIVYEVYVDATGGSYGRQLSWRVCVYDEAGNSACTGSHLIPQ
jgi:hypothetical protein